MDKMMKLWKELMRCFKDISQTQGRDKAVNVCIDIDKLNIFLDKWQVFLKLLQYFTLIQTFHNIIISPHSKEASLEILIVR